MLEIKLYSTIQYREERELVIIRKLVLFIVYNDNTTNNKHIYIYIVQYPIPVYIYIE